MPFAAPRRRTPLVLAGVVGAFLVAAPSALAGANASVTGGVLTYAGGASSANQTVVVSAPGSTVTITDTGTMAATAPCTLDGQSVTCPGVTTRIDIDTAAGFDTVNASGVAGLPVTMADSATASLSQQIFRGGGGDDTITDGALSPNVDSLHGGPGNDTLIGSNATGSYRFLGEGGNDTMSKLASVARTSNANADTYDGGIGFDRASYAAATVPLAVTLVGAVNGGIVGNPNDYIVGVEAVTGGSAGDSLTGNASPNVFAGAGGNDAVDGAAGNDFLGGGTTGDTTTQQDSLIGGDGSDTVTFSYLGSVTGVNVSLDGIANDGTATAVNGVGAPAVGSAAAGSVAQDVERVNGTNQGDVLSGASAPSGVTLVGNGGFDTLTGSSQNDFLDGGPEAANALDCGAGEADTYRITSAPAGPAPIRCERGL